MRASCSLSLVELAHLIDDAGPAGCRDVFVFARIDGADVVVGVRPLERHPCDELVGFGAPPQWWAVGFWLHGRARFLDRPSSPPEPIVSTYLLDRSGASASLLRRGDEVLELPGPTEGRIPDLCRKILGGGPS
jgi:hypothetical protein